jgi:hypothetical protein
MEQCEQLRALIEETRDSDDWLVLRQVATDGGGRIHLAVMVEPYLSYILEGKKKIESRFSKHSIAPYGRIAIGDLVLLKLTGGPVLGCFTASSVEFVELAAGEFRRVRETYSEAICADDDFWRSRQDKNFATLVGVDAAQSLSPARVAKSDRRGWVILREAVTPVPTPHDQLSLL